MTTESPEPGPRPRKYFDASITGDKWRPINKLMKQEFKATIETPDQLLQFIEKYSELYDAVEDKTMLKTAAFLCKQNAINTLRLLGFGLNVTLPAYLARKKVYKFINSHTQFQNLPFEFEHLKKLVMKESRTKTSMLKAANEYLKVLAYQNKLSGTRVQFESKKLSIPRMIAIMYDPDRDKRERAWRALYQKIAKQGPKYDKMYDGLRRLRTKMAKLNGYDNCRDYYHYQVKGRFDYTPEDCFKLHDAVEATFLPFIKELNDMRKDALQLDTVRPWDTKVGIDSKLLKPYATNAELVDKMINVFKVIKPEYGKTLAYMKANGFIDPDNRKGKVSGAMSMFLPEHHCGYIIANAVGIQYDVETLAHEGGHSMHSSRIDVPYAMYSEAMLFPMEIAEVASMTMELFLQDHLQEFYTDVADIKRARLEDLERSVRSMPWFMIIDAFQHWIYVTKPDHAPRERTDFFKSLVDRFETSTGIDYSGLDVEASAMWYRQTHVFQSPFYYIEYAIAQLAAYGIYKNYRERGHEAIDQYDAFLHEGYSKSLPELFDIAGVKFDFSKDYIQGLVDFLRDEFKSIANENT
ncbi:MAG TPA: M3 family metallopeptidase [Candidatus Lokiarchaeia archaeon]|nr:M3 family metallopeptidase [Candidatus Lokiarchaeia archaeon]